MRGTLDCRLMAAVFAVSLVSVTAIAAEPAPAPAPAPAKTAVAAPAPTVAPAADEIDQIKQPVDWFKWGADLRLRQEYHNDALTLNNDAKNHEWDYTRIRTRLWGSVLPTDNVSINGRLTWEGRYWLEPEPNEGWQWSYIIADQLNLQVKNLFETKSTLTVGRQDIIMNDGWLVLEGTPLDGSRTIFFDAARLQMQLPDDHSSLDLVVLQTHQDVNNWFPTFGNTANYPNGHNESSLVEQDELGVIADYKYTVDKRTNFDAYYIYKNSEAKLGNGDQGEVHTIGGRAEHRFDENWSARAQGAYQFGNERMPYSESQGRLNAYGATGRVTYALNDQWNQKVNFDAEYLSGDDPDTQTNEQFDPLWGRWPQWSELYIYTYARETRIAQVTNLVRIGPSWEANPTQKLSLSAAYYGLFANDRNNNNGFLGDGYFRGQLITAVAKYKFNRYLSGHLWAEYLVPGNYYDEDNRDDAVFLRAELNFTF